MITSGIRVAAVSLQFNFQKTPLRNTATLRKAEDKWVIESLPIYSPCRRPRGQQRQ